MELNGKAKDTVEQVQDLNEAKAAIAEAGKLLSDDEVGTVAGGINGVILMQCPHCRKCFESQIEFDAHYEMCAGHDLRLHNELHPTSAQIFPAPETCLQNPNGLGSYVRPAE